jgi:hypothetical protein
LSYDPEVKQMVIVLDSMIRESLAWEGACLLVTVRLNVFKNAANALKVNEAKLIG